MVSSSSLLQLKLTARFSLLKRLSTALVDCSVLQQLFCEGGAFSVALLCCGSCVGCDSLLLQQLVVLAGSSSWGDWLLQLCAGLGGASLLQQLDVVTGSGCLLLQQDVDSESFSSDAVFWCWWSSLSFPTQTPATMALHTAAIGRITAINGPSNT